MTNTAESSGGGRGRGGSGGGHGNISLNVPTGQKLRSETVLSAKEITCGIGGFRPQWMQPFASANFFVINFSILAILQGALFTYMVGIISTLEKRYAFEAKVSGFLLIADNLSQMVVSPIVGYLGSKYNRSRLIAIGELVVAISCFMSAIPYFIYGTAQHLGSQVFNRTSVTNYDLCVQHKNQTLCDQPTDGHSTVLLAVVILWMACFANGLGYTAFYTIGLPYVDDNIKKKNSPIYLSTISTIRLLGPTLGFIMSSICLQFYENPLAPPSFNNHDPRWIGAWWLGFLILGSLILIFTIPMFLFPKSFTQKTTSSLTNKNNGNNNDNNTNANNNGSSSSENISTFKDAKQAFIRFSKNSLLICHICGGVFRVIGYLGYYVVKPKYIELQYRQTAASASFFTGAASVATMAIGTMAGGVIIKSFKPRARSIAIFVVIVEFLSSIAIFGGMFLQCPTPQFFALEQLNPTLSPFYGHHQFQQQQQYSYNQQQQYSYNQQQQYQQNSYPSSSLSSSSSSSSWFNPYPQQYPNPQQQNYQCNQGCACTGEVYQPVCSRDGQMNYFSPCYAGCKKAYHLPDGSDNTIVTFHNCSCTSNPQMVTSGLCQTDCNRFPMYITLIAISNTIASTARTGDTLLTLRSVDPQDKSFAMGIMGTIFAVFAFIPYPLIFGAIIDSTCMIWEKSCQKTGNCWLYDIDKYRIYMHLSAFTFLMIGVILEIGTVCFAGRIKNLYDEDDDNVEMKQIEPSTTPAIPSTPPTAPATPSIDVTAGGGDAGKFNDNNQQQQ